MQSAKERRPQTGRAKTRSYVHIPDSYSDVNFAVDGTLLLLQAYPIEVTPHLPHRGRSREGEKSASIADRKAVMVAARGRKGRGAMQRTRSFGCGELGYEEVYCLNHDRPKEREGGGGNSKWCLLHKI